MNGDRDRSGSRNGTVSPFNTESWWLSANPRWDDPGFPPHLATRRFLAQRSKHSLTFWLPVWSNKPFPKSPTAGFKNTAWFQEDAPDERPLQLNRGSEPIDQSVDSWNPVCVTPLPNLCPQEIPLDDPQSCQMFVPSAEIGRASCRERV